MRISTSLYRGRVRHTRVKPRVITLKHKCFWLALDIDCLSAIASRLYILSRNTANILSFHDRDHGDGGDKPLREQVEALLATAGLSKKPASIILFCMPRVLGYGFNPISMYLCHNDEGIVYAVVYQVHNTFGQRHSYVVPVEECNGRSVQSANKSFYVSPFMDMDLQYTFKLEVSETKLLLSISAADSEGPVIFTSLAANRAELSNRALLTTWLAHPLLTFKVISAIHFHAVRIWIKGIKLRLRPPPPEQPATMGQSGKVSQ
jgi:uncharacterized protein